MSPLQEVSTLIRYLEPTGRAWERADLGIPQDPMPLKIQGHGAGRIKVLFMESQQETHENIPALRIPQENHENIPSRGIPTGKPKEHFSLWGSSWESESMFPATQAGQWVEGWRRRLAHPHQRSPAPQTHSKIPLASLGWGAPFENWLAWLPVLLSLLQVAVLLPRFHAEHMTPCSCKGLCNLGEGL